MDAPQVASAFVLQYLLQVPAQTLAYAVRLGPWRVDPATLTFTLGPHGTPEQVRLAPPTPGLDATWEVAERDYRRLAEPLATAYRSIVTIGSGTRLGMVDDLWAMAVRDATGDPHVVARRSCCFLYALPGCHECAGCPRLRRPL